MSESIFVGYRELGSGYYHKFLVYTDSGGERWVASGWTGENGQAGLSDLSQSGSSGRWWRDEARHADNFHATGIAAARHQAVDLGIVVSRCRMKMTFKERCGGEEN